MKFIRFPGAYSLGSRGLHLPQKIVCSGCKEVLYEGELLKSPQDVIKKYEGHCPKCKKELRFSTDGVVVTPHEE
jgi:hypothetical protein